MRSSPARLGLPCLLLLGMVACGRPVPEPAPRSPAAAVQRDGPVVVIPTLPLRHEEGPPADTQAVERGLEFRLREGSAAPIRPATTGPAATLALPPARTAFLLGRLPGLPVEARDTFRFPLRSPPPPRTGATVLAAFPPPDSVGPPRPDSAAMPVEPLEVARVTPTGETATVPEVIVTFSQPMVALNTVSAIDARQLPVRMSPQPAGRWTWLDTRTLRFEPTARLPMATRYVVEVPAGTRSANGAALASAFRAEFSTAPLRATGAFPNRGIGSNDGLPMVPLPPGRRASLPQSSEFSVTGLDPIVLIEFDQRIDRAALLPSLRMTVDGIDRPLRLASPQEVAADSVARRVVVGADDERWVAVRPVTRLPRDAAVTVAVLPGAPSAEGPRASEVRQELYFRTYGPLRVADTSCGGPEPDVCFPRAGWVISFTNRLDSAAWSPSYVRVEPAIPDLSVRLMDGRIFLEGNARPRTRYRVTLDPELRDRFGQTLGSMETLDFQVGDAQPLLSLVGAPFVVLDPAGPPRVLVHARGQGPLRVRIYRVTPELWPAYEAAVRAFQENPGAGSLNPPGELVSSTTVAPPAEPGDFAERAIHVTPALRDGLGHAVVVVESAEAQSPDDRRRSTRSPTYAWVQSTRIGLTAMVDQDELLGWATSLRDGQPLAGVELRLLPTGARTTTDARGIGAVDLSGTASNLLVGRRGEDAAILPENPYGYSGEGWRVRSAGGELRWLLFTDRGLYRPGEQARLKGWIRRADLEQGAGLALPGVDRVRYTVTGPRQEEIAAGQLTPGALGGFDATITLPAALNLGGAQVRLEATGARVPEMGREAWHPLQVQDFRRPEYDVSVAADAGPHIVGATVPAAVTAAYYSGGGLADAQVQWRALSRPAQFTPPGWDEWTFGRPLWWDAGERVNQRTLEGRTGADGQHRVQLDLVGVDPPFPSTIRLDAQVGDVNRQVGSAGTDILVHPAALYAGLRAARSWVNPGDTLGIEIAAVDIGGRALSGRSVVVTAERVEWRWIPRTGRQDVTASQSRPVCTVTTAAEPVRCVWRAEGGGSYRLRAEIRDDAGRVSRTELQIWVASDQAPPSPDREDPSAVSVVPDRREYQPGDTAEILIRSPFYPAIGKLTLRQYGLVRTEQFRMDAATRVLRVPITDEHIPNVHVHVELVDSRVGTTYGAGESNLSVPPRRRELAVSITPADSVALPGAASSLQIEVRGPDGRPAPGAEVAVWMVDESILSLGGYQLPDPLAVFYPQRYPNIRDLALRQFVVPAPRSAGPGTVSAVLIDAATGQRMGGIPVRLEGTSLEAFSDAGGTFTIAGVAPGTYSLVVEGPGGTTRRSIEVPVAGIHLGTIVLSESAGSAREESMVTLQSSAVAALPAMAPPPPPAPGNGAPLRSRGAVGGAADAKQSAAEQVALRTEFAPLALFEPSLRTDASGRVRVPVRLPQSLTRYRVMAVAVAGADRFGRGESTVTTRRDLMIRPTAPRFLNFGDRVEISVLLQNATDAALVVDVAARGNGIRMVDPQGQRVTVPARDRVEVRFPAIADGAGTAQLQVVATAGRATDAATASFPVYTPATAEAFATYGEMDTGRPLILPVGVPDSVLPQFGGLEVTLSSTAVQELTDAVLYLQRYPFEGAEQIASRVLAIAALRDVLTAFRAEGLPAPDSLLAAVQRDVGRLAALQGADGGWSYWRPDHPSDPYVSIHVAHALQRARENDFAIPAGALERALDYLRTRLPTETAGYGARVRTALTAYSLYVRDRAGEAAAETEAARLVSAERAARPLDDLPLEPAGWLLHVLADEPTAAPIAQELLRTIRNRATETASTATFVTSYGGEDHLLLFSARRSDAVVLEALIAADPTTNLIPKAVRGLLEHRTRGRWSGTQENAWALLALQRYFRTYERVTPSFRSSVWLGERFAGDYRFQGRTTERFHLDIPMREVLRADTTQPLTLSRAGEGRLYYRAGLRYAPADLALDALQRGFSVERVYEAVDDSADVRRDQYGNWRIRAGARVRVRLAMTAPSRRFHVALVDPLPAGLEPINTALQGTGFGEEPMPPRPMPAARSIRAPGPGFPIGQWFIHQNLRDDRAEAFANLLPAGRHEYTYLARATTPGTFVVPPPRAEEMYHPETFGRGASGRVIVE